VSVSGGTLNLTARQEAAPFTCSDPYGNFTTSYTSGMVSTFTKFSQTYGLYQVRAKLPPATIQGLQETFWLYPVNPAKYGPAWPDSGEIDFAEFYSEYPGFDVPFVHYVAAAPDPNVTAYNCNIGDITAFHTYGVQWTPTTLTMYYDGNTCLVDHWNPAAPLSGSQPFDQPFFLVLTQAMGLYTNAFLPGVTPLPATTQIDWIHIWS
jgi:beta-glucanase (GH16 family)